MWRWMVACVSVLMAGCGGSGDVADGDVARVAVEAAAEESLRDGVEGFDTNEVTEVGDCAAVEVTETWRDEPVPMTVFLRRIEGEWQPAHYVTGHVADEIDEASLGCYHAS